MCSPLVDVGLPLPGVCTTTIAPPYASARASPPMPACAPPHACHCPHPRVHHCTRVTAHVCTSAPPHVCMTASPPASARPHHRPSPHDRVVARVCATPSSPASARPRHCPRLRGPITARVRTTASPPASARAPLRASACHCGAFLPTSVPTSPLLWPSLTSLCSPLFLATFVSCN